MKQLKLDYEYDLFSYSYRCTVCDTNYGKGLTMF